MVEGVSMDFLLEPIVPIVEFSNGYNIIRGELEQVFSFALVDQDLPLKNIEHSKVPRAMLLDDERDSFYSLYFEAFAYLWLKSIPPRLFLFSADW